MGRNLPPFAPAGRHSRHNRLMPPRVWLGLVAVSAMAADVTPGAIRIARIRYQTARNLTRIPNYTCTQTIERSTRRARGRRFLLTDTLRLEVALVDGNELFAWPGAGKFEDKKISDIVGGGTIGNGSFALHARSVFMSGSPRFEFDGERQRDGRAVFRYEYHVPVNLSGYEIKVGAASARVAYSGWFEIDAQSLDLIELNVTAREIPSTLAIQSATDTMRYKRFRIGESDSLLPESSELVMTDLDGNENRNVTRFDACRQYAGESVLSFGDPDSIVDKTAPVTEAVELPVGMGIETALDTPVRFGMAIGDLIAGRLSAPAKHKGRVMIPKGAMVHARITKLEKGYARTEVLRIGLKLEEIEFPGAKARPRAILEDAGPTVYRNIKIGIDRQGVIWLTGNQPELSRGIRLLWRVADTAAKENP